LAVRESAPNQFFPQDLAPGSFRIQGEVLVPRPEVPVNRVFHRPNDS
jgi:hypothetical protein